MDLTGQTLLGKYEIEGLLGQGGMGAVWRARHSMTGRKLAIKVLDEGYVGNEQVAARFGREARAASAIHHPGIVEVLDLDTTEGGVPFMVMEFLEGETLASRIERRGRLGQEEMLRLGTMMLEALDAAHSHGVIHRDLKPENIYVVPAGRRGEAIKILDFGISQMKTTEEQRKLTMTGSVLGTPHYMSPEQAMGESQLDHRADLYAAGVVLYECVVGDVPYDAPNYNKLLRLILDDEPERPRARGAEISDQVERVILWAMEKRREHRVPSAKEMLSWLKRAAAGEEPPYGEDDEPEIEIEMGDDEPADLGLGELDLSPVAPTKRSTGTPRPAGSLPSHTSGSYSLSGGFAAESVGAGAAPAAAEVPDEEGGDWQISPTLASRASQQVSSPPPPSGSVELEMGLDTPPPSGEVSLELDENALRTSQRPPASMPPGGPAVGVGSASSSGRHRAIGHPSSSGDYPAIGSSAASIPAPAARTIPPRLADLEMDEGPREEPEPPAWRRYLILAAIGLAVFVGLVFAVRWIVQPGAPDPTTTPGPVVDEGPDEPSTPSTRPEWISIRVVGLPPGAHMQLDGLPANTPLRVRRGGEHTLLIRADGYEDRTIELQTDRNRTIHARMVPAVGTVQTTP